MKAVKKVTYRILSACAGIGYGFPESSFREALKSKIDLIAADAGSVDPGPYYLGKGVSYMEKPQTKRDFAFMLEAAIQQGCPLIIGSCGLAGDTPNLEFMLDIVQEVFEELSLRDIRVAVISGHVDNELLIGHMNDLKPLGKMPPLTESMIKNSAIVGQMGVAPFIKALEEEAQVILAGRSCDVAIFAADPIRRRIDPGLAFHAAHILECGAAAAEPSSGMDCLIGEFLDDESVIFIAPCPNRRTTIESIAAHTLFEEAHPLLQFYPEGVLSFLETEYFQHDIETAGLRKSVFIHRPLTLKLEGSERKGARIVSLFFCKSLDAIPDEYMVYGRNGVEPTPVGKEAAEIGLLLRVSGDEPDDVGQVATVLKSHFLHCEYAGRVATAGNLAFPLSPSKINYQDEHGHTICIVVGGTRDPFFQSSWDQIKDEALASVRRRMPECVDRCDIEIIIADRKRPLLFLETIADTEKQARQNHQKEIDKLETHLDDSLPAIQSVNVEDAFQWSLYHLLSAEALIKEQLFPITLFRTDGLKFQRLKEVYGSYTPIGLDHYNGELEEEKLASVEGVNHRQGPIAYRPLIEMAAGIRSKNAGVNRITYEVYFHLSDDYRQALDSGIFVKELIAGTLQIPLDQMMGSFRADACRAIKITAHRAVPSGTPGERDVFGAQQYANLLSLKVPIFGPP